MNMYPVLKSRTKKFSLNLKNLVVEVNVFHLVTFNKRVYLQIFLFVFYILKLYLIILNLLIRIFRKFFVTNVCLVNLKMNSSTCSQSKDFLL